METRIVLTEYIWTGLSGTRYYPAFDNGKWRFVNTEDHNVCSASFTFEQIMAMAGIPEEDRIIIVLKCGQGRRATN